jgi:hypothetical protein
VAALKETVVSDLSWRDLQTLSILASERADDASLPDDSRDHWADVAERLMSSSATPSDLRETAKLAELDAAQQYDEKTRQRYLSLARRAIDAR